MLLKASLEYLTRLRFGAAFKRNLWALGTEMKSCVHKMFGPEAAASNFSIEKPVTQRVQRENAHSELNAKKDKGILFRRAVL